ncbi:hypothetical protein ACMZ7Q_00845 [Gardnerella vaginalis]|uniref:hypothetical protein n=1 Tax=Gardnerella vaginalis TaxID=2702 RepID=UPI0039F0E7A9
MLKKKVIGAFVAAATLLSGFAFASLAPVAFATDGNSGSDIEKNCEVREKYNEEFRVGLYNRTLYCKDSSSSEYHEASLAERKEWSIAVAKKLNVPGEFIKGAKYWCSLNFCPLGSFVNYDRVESYVKEKLKNSDVFCYYAVEGLPSLDEKNEKIFFAASGGPEYCDESGCKDASISTNEYKVCQAHGYFNDGEDQSGSDQTPAPETNPTKNQNSKPDGSSPAKSGSTVGTAPKLSEGLVTSSSSDSTSSSNSEANDQVNASASVPTAPKSVNDLKPEVENKITVGNNNVAQAGAANKVTLHVDDAKFNAELKENGSAKAYAFIYSTPKLLHSVSGSDYVTVKLGADGVPYFDAQFPAGYSGKHTVVLVDKEGKQLAWTNITVVNNVVKTALDVVASNLPGTGVGVGITAIVMAVLAGVGVTLRKVRR